MRNDEYDELNDLPRLRAEPTGHPLAAPRHGYAQSVPQNSNGPLWAVVVVLLCVLAALGYWSHQQLQLMAQQLVATQDSFAHISEEAAGRIQDISGKMVATESSVTTENESLKLRVKQLETTQANLERQLQSLQAQQKNDTAELKGLNGHLAGLDKRLEAQAGEQKNQLKTLTSLENELKAAAQTKTELARLDSQLKAQGKTLESLSKDAGISGELRALQQEVLVLRSGLENPPAAELSLQEFDAFRAQMSRSVSTLQAQVQNLQQQINAR